MYSVRAVVPCLVVAGILGLSLGGCAGTSRGNAVPLADADRAVALDNPAIRTWEDPMSAGFRKELFEAAKQEMVLRAAAGETGPLPTANYLAISGGGADGAYGAGLLCGWTATGKRPEFKLVTGISTGALTAPFAFLGPKYDQKMKEMYTKTKTSDLLSSRGLMGALFEDGMMDTDRLGKVIAKTFDEEMLKDIVTEYKRGRLLLVATTNLDSGRPMLWNIGAIAASGHKDAAALIHKVLRASAAIPAAFPPVMIDVEVDGKKYQEMHVDGGATAQLFLYPPEFRLRQEAAAEGVVRERRAYIIRNARLDGHWSQVERRTLSIAGRAISALIQYQGIGDLYRVYAITQRDGVDYNLAFIPRTFNITPKEDFDPVYMGALFEVGYQSAVNGEQWAKYPPEFAHEDQRPPVTPTATPAQ